MYATTSMERPDSQACVLQVWIHKYETISMEPNVHHTKYREACLSGTCATSFEGPDSPAYLRPSLKSIAPTVEMRFYA